MSRDMTKPTKGLWPSEDSDQPGNPPSLIRVFAVRMKKAWVLSYPLNAQRRLGSDWADAQADLSLRWAHSHFVSFVMSWLIYTIYTVLVTSGLTHFRIREPIFKQRNDSGQVEKETFGMVSFLILLKVNTCMGNTTLLIDMFRLFQVTHMLDTSYEHV